MNADVNYITRREGNDTLSLTQIEIDEWLKRLQQELLL